MRLKGKVSIVTGGARRIGLATARKFTAARAIAATAILKAICINGAVIEAAGGLTV